MAERRCCPSAVLCSERLRCSGDVLTEPVDYIYALGMCSASCAMQKLRRSAAAGCSTPVYTAEGPKGANPRRLSAVPKRSVNCILRHAAGDVSLQEDVPVGRGTGGSQNSGAALPQNVVGFGAELNWTSLQVGSGVVQAGSDRQRPRSRIFNIWPAWQVIFVSQHSNVHLYTSQAHCGHLAERHQLVVKQRRTSLQHRPSETASPPTRACT
jgi:hypothetical protein